MPIWLHPYLHLNPIWMKAIYWTWSVAVIIHQSFFVLDHACDHLYLFILLKNLWLSAVKYTWYIIYNCCHLMATSVLYYNLCSTYRPSISMTFNRFSNHTIKKYWINLEFPHVRPTDYNCRNVIYTRWFLWLMLCYLPSWWNPSQHLSSRIENTSVFSIIQANWWDLDSSINMQVKYSMAVFFFFY